MADRIKLSVLVRTYNHDRFIDKAISSVLLQDTNFEYEIVVGDDCSTDKTREHLNRIKSSNPEKVRLILHEEQVGPRNNLDITLQACNGEYIALLDGDDYWTSRDKLQKQVAFLDNNSFSPMSCHNCMLVYENPKFVSKPLNIVLKDSFLSVEQLIEFSPALSSTTVFRRSAALHVKDLPHILLRDKAFAVALAHRHGPIGYYSDVMSAWRIHGGGVLNSKYKLPAIERRINSHNNQIDFYEAIDEYLDYRYHTHIAFLVTKRHYSLAWSYIKKRSWQESYTQVKKGWCAARIPGDKTSFTSIGIAIKLLWKSIAYYLNMDVNERSRVHEHTRAAESSSV